MDELQLWYARPHDLADPGVAQACAALLSREEREHWQSFRHEERRRESLATRALARIALSHVHPTRPEDWNFAANAQGKPHTEPDCGLRFNLSNSAALVACLVAKGAEVGVDLEPLERAEQILHLAEMVFSAQEREQLGALATEGQRDRALSLWTLKEAYIKARGLGLRLPLQAISFVFDQAAGIRMELQAEIGDDARNWSFCLLDHARHRVAVMVERKYGWKLLELEALLPQSDPVPVADTVPEWFPRS
jgi:4'-phosphopantetheinyl transferase